MKKICIVIIALLYLTLASCGWLLNDNLNDDTDIVYTTTITGQVTTDSTSSLIFSTVDETILSSCDTTLTTGVPGLAIEIIDTVNGESFECTQGAVITDDTGCYSCTITEINDNVMLIASSESDAENSHYGTHVNLDDCSIGKDCEANVDAQSTILVSLLKETFYTIAESTTLNIDCLSVVEIDNIHSDMETYHTELEDSLGNYPLTSEDETEIMTIDSEESSNMLISQIEYIQSIFYDQFPTTNTEFDTLHDFREDLSEQVTLTLQCEDDDNDGIVNRYDDDDDGDGVLDEVDNDPVLSGETTYLLMENITNVGIYTATDSDNDTLTFSLAGDDADFFVFNDSTNLLSFINVADYETQVTYNIILTVSDGVNSRSLPIVVVLEDENDNVITIESSDIFSINENETHIGYLVATDTNEETLNYSLVNDESGYFSVDSSSGLISSSVALDYEQTTAYTLTVAVNDSLNTSTQIITIDVININDNEPEIVIDTTLSVYENQTDITTFSVTDLDNDTITLSLSGADADYISIDSSTYEIYFTSISDVDYETQDVFYVTLSIADDDFSNSYDLTIYLEDINDNSPVFSTETTFTYDENATTAIQHQAIDLDNDTIEYSLSGSDESAFTLDSSTGELWFNSPPDFETKTTYDLIITASDGSNSTDQSITISINNLNDNIPEITSSETQSVDENQSSISTIIATDADNDTLTLTLSGTDSSAIQLDDTTHQITFIEAPDYENQSSYTVIITASDGLYSATQVMTISINDVNESPVLISETSFSVLENINNVGTIIATDEDTSDTITYTHSGVDSSLFSLDSSTGELTLITSEDYENPTNDDNIYTLTIEASDSVLTAEQTLTVTVLNDNDNVPIFSSSTSYSIDENTATVGSAIATDADGDTNDDGYDVLFSLTGTDASYLSVAETTGVISFDTAPDYEDAQDSSSDNNYTVTITADDGDYTTQQSITISIQNINDNDPEFTSGSSFTADENQTAIGTITAVDADGDLDGDGYDVLFSISGGNDSSLFTINAITGVIVFNTEPNYEDPSDSNGDNAYIVIVQASDGERTTEQTITIAVQDVNDAPVFTTSTSLFVNENNESSQIAATVIATDEDGDSLTYNISGTDSSEFETTTNGNLYFITTPDYENTFDADGNNDYSLIITADDGALTTDQNMVLYVTNINDNSPSISNSNSVSIQENITSVTTVNGIDADGDTLVYSISGIDSSFFTIDTSSGELNFNTAPDYESPLDNDGNNIYYIKISVSDGDNSTPKSLYITVTDDETE